MEVIDANNIGWSKERHNLTRVAVVDEEDNVSFAKELAALRVRVDKRDGPKKKETT